MLSSRLFKLAISGLGIVAALASCSSSSNSPSGSGGSAVGSRGMASGGVMSSGSMASGGVMGSGGVASGGILGSGGMASGGSLGSGGMASGGAMGSGSMANGGATGSGAGGKTESGGAVAGGGGSAGTMLGAGGGGGSTGSAIGGADGGTESGTFDLTSPDLMDGAHFDSQFTCAASNGTFGSGVNPELDWSGAPAGTMSFAITFIDTTLGDTNPMGQHWAIWNIPATVMKLPQATATLTGDLAMAKQSGKFLAPCAQSLTNNMDDQYAFTIYALSTATLDVTGTTVANALTALKAISPLGTAVLHGHAGLKGQ